MTTTNEKLKQLIERFAGTKEAPKLAQLFKRAAELVAPTKNERIKQ
jgi:hypothetical protein